MSDVWTNFGKKSKEVASVANDIAGGLIPLALAAALGGALADIAIRSSKAKFKSPWAATLVIFATGWALLRFLPREGVRLIVAGMFGRLGPEAYTNVVKPLGKKLGVDLEGLEPSSGQQPAASAPKEQAKPPALPPGDQKDKKPANYFGMPYATNDEGWTPPDVRPIAQGVLENRQNLYNVSGEIFNEMRRRNMVDPSFATETQGDFERLMEDVFTRMAA